MQKLVLVLWMLWMGQNVIAQKHQVNNPYTKMVNAEGLKKHLTVIASDAMEGRETGTEGQRKAAAYIEEAFKKMGLKKVPSLNGYQQFYPLKQDSLVNASININEQLAIYGSDYIVPLNVNETGWFKGSEMIFVGYGIDDPLYSDYNNKLVEGKVVVFFAGEPKKDGKYFMHPEGRPSPWTFPGIGKKLEAATRKGAIGALMINPAQENFTQKNIDNSKRNGIRLAKETDTSRKINGVLLAHAFARQLFGSSMDTLLSNAKNNQPLNNIDVSWTLPVNMHYTKYTRTVYASNVAGIIEGSDKKDEYVFLTAHYDHLGKQGDKIYNGADDDGSGTVTVLQMAAAFAKAKKDGHGPRRTVVCMTVSGEEKGLWGSEYYAEHPFYPTEKTSVDLNTDMIGRVDTERKTADTLNYVYVVGHDKISSELPIINEGINNLTTQLVLDYKFDDPKDPNRIYYRSDHYNFARKGIPVLFFYDGMLKADYHQPTDDIEFINWPLFEKRAQMIFNTAWEMANRDNMLVRDKPLPTGTR